jgi:hypothetical protein
LTRLASILVRKIPLRFLIGRLIFEDEDENPRKKARFPNYCSANEAKGLTAWLTDSAVFRVPHFLFDADLVDCSLEKKVRMNEEGSHAKTRSRKGVSS